MLSHDSRACDNAQCLLGELHFLLSVVELVSMRSFVTEMVRVANNVIMAHILEEK